MGFALIKIRLMPISPEINLEEIKTKSEEIIRSLDGQNCSFQEEPIAFGLKAVIASFALDESKELEGIENKLEAIENVNSIQVIDMRRALS
jgi:elongation factor 1-beta